MVRDRIRAVLGIYEWFEKGYERSGEYTSGSGQDTSGPGNIRVVRMNKRAVQPVYLNAGISMSSPAPGRAECL
ncbi:hypothetical protein [Sporosarcina cyprini]|uniref:hypothetical protein n=1 Tax=Sporosarcina cyprini TaxID=2910523 RepID=UPI001EDF8D10|nr:hypothetical protein [Sporosarcina cyprini]MCG3089330.1 hypothetical protein [Sporosarcina cyprini]